MPRFTEEEKNYYYDRLMSEGERLFNQKGLKSVTVDEITANIGLGKGTFYHFFHNKEHLFMSINNKIQKDIFQQVVKVLENTLDQSNEDRLYEILMIIMNAFKKHPMVINIDSRVYEKLLKKVPISCMEENNANDTWMLDMIIESGIEFKYPQKTVMKLLQGIFLNVATFLKDSEGEKSIEILFRAISNEIIK
ncbi:TetR family transcriptional regulator [Natranaerovirga hydrolytica]|uniref:TetR family transcriptional regulator n=1 Tax=Natranaerovirga hydrolytica TaxID=680378 RepID=A0A4V2Q074_9FIRM|nr:TetR/AcrR family transcriptional regulator [Natranaerovirga hydrolytica]TCK92651.1 TetR family transcriptional regulator [Natranaerovirga hydrolytica]